VWVDGEAYPSDDRTAALPLTPDWMERAFVPDDPRPDAAKSDPGKSDEAHAGGALARAYDRIKSAEEDLARLDQLVSGMERSNETPRPSQANTGAEAVKSPEKKPSEDKTPGHKAPLPDGRVRDQGPRRDRTMIRALVGLVLAIGILGAAFASQYRDEAKVVTRSIMARWAPPAASGPPPATAVESPPQPPAVHLAAADGPSSMPAPPAAKETESAPKPAATTPDPSSSDLAPSLKTITSELASINAKLEQLKSRNEQTLREQADTIQQLKAAQEKDAADNARLAAQVQALQTQLTTSSKSASAKPVVRSVMNNDTAAPARPHVQAAAPRRPRPPPRGPWMPPPYMVDPYGDPDW